VIIIGNASLYFGTLEEELQWAIFFLVVFVARANQKIRILALGRTNTEKIRHKLKTVLKKKKVKTSPCAAGLRDQFAVADPQFSGQRTVKENKKTKSACHAERKRSKFRYLSCDTLSFKEFFF
jgi:hypothetical protein